MLVRRRKLRGERSAISIDESVGALHRVTYFAPSTLTSEREKEIPEHPA